MSRRIAIVEDEAAIRENYADVLRKQGYEVQTYANRKDAMAAFDMRLPNLAIIDIGLENEIDGGFTLCQALRSMSETLPIIFLTARDNDFDTVSGLRMGADDYLTKPFSAEELQLRVKALLKRVKLQVDSPEQKIVQIGTYIFDTENFTLKSPSQLITLTKKEAMILRTLNKFKNQLIPRDVILNSVWGQDDYFVGRSLDVFITKLRKYLKEDTTIQINNVHGVGFKFECQE
mgnify:CR=1 FL=1